MVEQKIFNGIMNLDDVNDILPSRHHKYAMNIKFRGNTGNMEAQNINGNTLITNSLPSGDNQCIGAIFDDVKNRIYYFNYNSLGRNGIYYYNTLTRTISPILISFTNSSTDIFNFDPLYPIASINILYKDTTEGDVLYWIDRLNRPRFLNVKDATSNLVYSSGTAWLSDYLTVARQMPLIAPLCLYANRSPTSTVNNLKTALYQFRYRWIYRDNTKSTWSPWSKMFTPYNVDSLSTDTDLSKNNEIQVNLNTGPADCIKIEIGARRNLSTTFGDAISIEVINKSIGPLSNNAPYLYKFYNDNAYDYVNAQESILLFDSVPKLANAQELINGNLLIYGGITEGYNPNITLNTSVTTSLITNVQGNNTPVLVTGSDSQTGTPPYTGSYYIDFTGVPVAGDIVTIKYNIYDSTRIPTNTSVTIFTTAPSSVLSSFANTARTQFNSNSTLNTYQLQAYNTGNGFSIESTSGTSKIVSTVIILTYITPTGTVVPNDVSSAMYKHNSRYTFGLVYFDEFGVTNSVMTNSSLKVITPEISTSTPATTALFSAALSIPNIQVSISHQPPTWAKYFSFVRTNNITVSEFKTIKSDGVYKDGVYGYIDITNYNTNTNSYPAYEFVKGKGDRVRVVGINGGIALSPIPDYPILDLLLTKPAGAPVGFPATGFFIKVPYDSAIMVGWSTSSVYYIEAYTPALTTDTDLLFFYEFGETYSVVTDINGNRVHQGMAQTQIVGTGVQPAIYNFYRGDTYERLRSDYFILDMSISDNYLSKIVGNGRPFVIDTFASQRYNSTLVRYGGSFQQGTLINDINRFYDPNYEEYDKQKGDIQRLKLKEKVLRIFQSRGTGVVNVYATEMTNQDGTTNLIGSTSILNPINYYSGSYGIGNQYCSLTSSSSSDYYVDPINGYHIRLGRDGNTALSELYKGQYFFPSIANKYLNNPVRTEGGYAKILGVYDNFEEEYVSIFQTSTTLPGYTVGFSEKKNAYSSFYSYQPEWIESAENLLVSWKNGGLYVHDSATKNTFYGTYTGSSITLVFNDKNVIKKTFDNISIDANDIWDSATIGFVNTSLGQTSNLVASDYELHEGFRHAALMRDNASLGGIINGDYLKGTWIEVKLNNSATNLVYLSGLYMGYQVSPRNF